MISLQEYGRFIRKQLEAGRAEASGRFEVSPEPGCCFKAVISACSPPHHALPGRAEGDVYLVFPAVPREVAAGHPLFINLCSYSKMGAPRTADGRAVLERRLPPASWPLPDLLSLEIPLNTGSVRPIKGTGARGSGGGRYPASNTEAPPALTLAPVSHAPPVACAARSEWAVDVLVHAWVVELVQRHATFRPHFVSFLESCLASELGITLRAAAAAPSGSAAELLASIPYAGGSVDPSTKREGPARFLVSVRKDVADAEERRRKADPRVVVATVMESPSTLLRAAGGDGGGTADAARPAAVATAPATIALPPRAQQAVAQAGNGRPVAPTQASAAPSRPLVQELPPDGGGSRELPLTLGARLVCAWAEVSLCPVPAPTGADLTRPLEATAGSPRLLLRVSFRRDAVDTAALAMDDLVVEVSDRLVQVSIAPGRLLSCRGPDDAEPVASTGRASAPTTTLAGRLPVLIAPEALEARFSRKACELRFFFEEASSC